MCRWEETWFHYLKEADSLLEKKKTSENHIWEKKSTLAILFPYIFPLKVWHLGDWNSFKAEQEEAEEKIPKIISFLHLQCFIPKGTCHIVIPSVKIKRAIQLINHGVDVSRGAFCPVVFFHDRRSLCSEMMCMSLLKRKTSHCYEVNTHHLPLKLPIVSHASHPEWKF